MFIFILSLMLLVIFFLKASADSYSTQYLNELALEAEKIMLQSTMIFHAFDFPAAGSKKYTLRETLLNIVKQARQSGTPFADSLALFKKQLEVIALSFDKLRRMYYLLLVKFLLLALPLLCLRIWVNSENLEESSLIYYDALFFVLASLIFSLLFYFLKRLRIPLPLLIRDFTNSTLKGGIISQQQFAWLIAHLYATQVPDTTSAWSLDDLDREELKIGSSLKKLKRQRLELAVQKDNQVFEFSIDRFADTLPLIEIFGFGFPALLLSIIPLIKLLGISE
ncbi:MAG: hypothetical protein KBD78_10620 [Oligoflexales bacterium]|nr:hypothetical protein [Oligoflexales bacterium]